MSRQTQESNKRTCKRWYEKKKIDHREKVKAYKKQTATQLREYKKGIKCERCPEDHRACLDFHHKEPGDKKAEISRMVTDGYCWNTILEEIGKCAVLCANCHRKEHDSLGECED